MSRSKLFFLFIFFLFIISLLTGLFYFYPPTPITFSAAGDFGANPDTVSVLQGLSKSKSDFVLALGDLKYEEIKTEKEWCNFVKKHLGTSLPFQIISGNHEANGPDGHIEKFLAEFPDRMSSRGVYGKEYYFDFPKRKPLARFILVSPDLFFKEGHWVYLKGDVHYQWLSQTIDEARAQKIPWVIVSCHKPNLTLGQKRNEVKDDILNLLVEKKVDVVLAAHDHNYQRSYPLAHGPDCREIVSGGFNPDCLAAQGTIFMVVGTGGRRPYPLSPTDEEAGYFSQATRENRGSQFGFLKIRLTAKKLTGEFVSTLKNSSFSDRFEIEKY